MMLRSSAKMFVQNGVVHRQPNPEKVKVKGRSVSHRCVAHHKASNSQVRLARMRVVLEYQCK